MSYDTLGLNDNQALWQEISEYLCQSRRQWFQVNFSGVYGVVEDETLILRIPNETKLKSLESCKIHVERAAKTCGFVGNVQMIVDSPNIFEAIIADELEDSIANDEGDTEVLGVYRNAGNAIVQPDKTEWAATQYFRKKWRPLLGPLLSELIRELRQRCHFKTHRNTFKTTYKSLSDALGVSEPTIKRALQRDKNGQFKNEYLSYFIAKMETIYDGKGDKIRTIGTRYSIYLDEPLTPDDEKRLSEYQNDL